MNSYTLIKKFSRILEVFGNTAAQQEDVKPTWDTPAFFETLSGFEFFRFVGESTSLQRPVAPTVRQQNSKKMNM